MSSNRCLCCGEEIPEGGQICKASRIKYGVDPDPAGKVRHEQREAEEQEALITWTRYNETRFPELTLLFHIPNGGSRNKFEAKRLKAQGVKAGVPDLFLPVPRGAFHGLFVEMKYGKNKQTDSQRQWERRLTEQKYAYFVCYSWREAADTIEKYLKQGGTGK